MRHHPVRTFLPLGLPSCRPRFFTRNLQKNPDVNVVRNKNIFKKTSPGHPQVFDIWRRGWPVCCGTTDNAIPALTNNRATVAGGKCLKTKKNLWRTVGATAFPTRKKIIFGKKLHRVGLRVVRTAVAAPSSRRGYSHLQQTIVKSDGNWNACGAWACSRLVPDLIHITQSEITRSYICIAITPE